MRPAGELEGVALFGLEDPGPRGPDAVNGGTELG